MKTKKYYDYFSDCACNGIVHENNKDALAQNAEILMSLNELYVFYEFVKFRVENGMISQFCKENIINICSIIRELSVDELRNERIDLINKIIICLNTQKEDNIRRYYATEYVQRMAVNKKYVYDDEIIKNFNLIINSIKFDSVVLFSHSDKITDEAFKVYENIFCNNLIYLLSINSILTNMPELYKDKLFIERLNRIVDVTIDKVDTNYEKRTFKNYKKWIFKQVKRHEENKS